MTALQVKDYLTLATPFDASELVDDMVNNIVKQALLTLNRYCPRIIRGDNSLLGQEYYRKRNIRALRTYQDMYTHEFAYQLSNVDIYKTGGVSGFFIYFAVDYTLEDIKEEYDFESVANTSAYYFFLELAKAYAFINCSNKRRSATLSELPFDIHGDTFHQEGKDRVDALILEMSNAFDNSI